MKTLFAFITLTFIISAQSWSAPVPVSVLKFKDKSNATDCRERWDYWEDHLGSAFKDMLITELTEHSNIEVLERANIQSIYDKEVELINSEKSEHKIEKGHFKKARYTFIGSVSGFEYCASRNKGSVNVGELSERAGLGGLFGAVAGAVNSVGASKAHAKVVIDLRLVDTQTGRILKSVKAEGEAARSNFNVDSDVGEYENSEDSPVPEAARSAIQKAAQKLLPLLKS